MKTIEEILKYDSTALDGRDLSRLAEFLTAEQIELMGMEFQDEESKQKHVPTPYTEEVVKVRLMRDLDFAFQKSLDKRGISAGIMVEVVAMWVWVLGGDVGADPYENYAQYGLPYLKAVALHYGFENPIGDDAGDEFCYSAEADYD